MEPFDLDGWEVRVLYKVTDCFNRDHGVFFGKDQILKARGTTWEEFEGKGLQAKDVLGLVKEGSDKVFLLEEVVIQF